MSGYSSNSIANKEGIKDLDILLKNMEPSLGKEKYIFCSVDREFDNEIISLKPHCVIREEEGLTLILKKEDADAARLAYEGIYRKITLLVHSSLEAVGLTAAFAKALMESGISANVVAGYYHDHIFVQEAKANDAIVALLKLTGTVDDE